MLVTVAFHCLAAPSTISAAQSLLCSSPIQEQTTLPRTVGDVVKGKRTAGIRLSSCLHPM